LLIKLSSLLLDFLLDKLVVFFDFPLEVVSVLESLLDLLLQLHLVFDLFTVIRDKLLGQLFDLLGLLLKF
jgi:hypothetical protein